MLRRLPRSCTEIRRRDLVERLKDAHIGEFDLKIASAELLGMTCCQTYLADFSFPDHRCSLVLLPPFDRRGISE